MKLPSSHENLEDAVYKHRKLHNNYYKSALKHLRVALYATPPVTEALHPLIQVLSDKNWPSPFNSGIK